MDQDMLAPLEAAMLLGITPELLFAYTRHPPKKASAPQSKLQIHDLQGRSWLRRSELQAFDAFLKEPWADAGAERPAIPPYIADYLKVECGSQCARCGAGFPLKNAHLNAYAVSRSHHHHNLIRLCGSCHEAFDDGLLPVDEIFHLKTELIASVRSRVKSRLDFHLPQTSLLPEPKGTFFGRTEELSALCEALSEYRVVLLHGAGGAGKTELLVQALTRCADAREVLWIEVDSETDPRALDLALRTALPGIGDTRFDALGTALDRFAGYVVIDGVEQADADGPVSLESVATALVTTTSRARFVFTSQVKLLDLPVDKALELGRLSVEASRAVICAGWDVVPEGPVEREALASLEEFADGHALTLRIANALLRFYESAVVVADRVAKHGSRALAHPTRKAPARLTSLEHCLRAAFEAIGDDARRLMYLVSHAPAGLPGVMPAFQDSLEDPQLAVATARRWHLLNVSSRAGQVLRISALSPIRAFMRDTFAHLDPVAAEGLLLALTRDLATQAVVLDHLYFSGGEVATGMHRFAAELPNLLHLLAQANKRADVNSEYLDHVRRIASSLQVYCFVAGSSDGAVEIMTMGIRAALRTSKWSSAADLAAHLFIHSSRLGSARVQGEAMAVLRDLVSQTFEPHVFARHAMAESMLALQERRHGDAVQWSETAVAQVSRVAGEGSRTGDTDEEEQESGQLLAMALMTSGRALEASHEDRPALAAYARSLELMRRLNDDVNPGAVLHQMGNCEARLENPTQAAAHYQEASRFFAERGVAVHIGNSLSELGYLLVESGLSPKALSAVDPEDIEFGADDVVHDAASVYLGPDQGEWAERCLVALRRVVGLCMLASLIGREDTVRGVCDTMRREVVALLAARRQEEGRLGPKPTAEDVPLMLLDMAMSVGGNLASLVHGDDGRPSMFKVGVTASLCFPKGTVPARLFPMSQWLAAYLCVCHGVLGLTARDLITADGLAGGDAEKFDLPPHRHLFDE